MAEVKICGLTTVDDTLRCIEAGADAIGLNFWPGSPRSIDVATARAIVEAAGDRVQLVGVFVDFSVAQIREILAETGIEWAQLHGNESPEQLAALLPRAYKAIGVKNRSAIELARTYPGEHLLLDASVPGLPGGTGRTFDWTVAAELARQRKLTLAGGLDPKNVTEAIETVNPFRVDVASGVESEPRRKDPDLVRSFIDAAKTAFSAN
ncbi:MAG: phosphoribosylanthranilate isomerase [Myxococcales bacterium]|nr:phosphoribosylanthranilate isomerase [Myxococcales bacterium]MDH3484020.1 phosphoribosylanthranilate isomerase [Myxococcales bacterium]